MTPLVLALAGLILIALALLILRRLGPAYRVGRLVAATPRVPMAEAHAFGRAGRRAYIGVTGRLDADDEFEDDAHRPLVFRRTRLAAQMGGRWTTLVEDRRAVAFTIRDGPDELAVDADALDTGLVVMPRMAAGRAADIDPTVAAGLDPSVLAGLDPETPVRLRIDQISSVEHATILGVPTAVDPADPAGPVRLTAGLGRPLVLTTLEGPEAMRVLAAEAPGRPRMAAGLLAAGLALEAIALTWVTLAWLTGQPARAASPSPIPAGDPRSPGEGPGFVGEPVLAIVVVLAIGLVSLIAVQVYVRLTGGPHRHAERSSDRGADTHDGMGSRTDR